MQDTLLNLGDARAAGVAALESIDPRTFHFSRPRSCTLEILDEPSPPFPSWRTNAEDQDFG